MVRGVDSNIIQITSLLIVILILWIGQVNTYGLFIDYKIFHFAFNAVKIKELKSKLHPNAKKCFKGINRSIQTCYKVDKEQRMANVKKKKLIVILKNRVKSNTKYFTTVDMKAFDKFFEESNVVVTSTKHTN